MISLQEYQDALKIVETYRRQQYIKEPVNIDSNIYSEMSIYDIDGLTASVYIMLKTLAEYELPEIDKNNLKVKDFGGLSKTQLLKYRNFGKRKLEILEHHLALAGLHLEP
jgi:hypothetical protein